MTEDPQRAALDLAQSLGPVLESEPADTRLERALAAARSAQGRHPGAEDVRRAVESLELLMSEVWLGSADASHPELGAVLPQLAAGGIEGAEYAYRAVLAREAGHLRATRLLAACGRVKASLEAGALVAASADDGDQPGEGAAGEDRVSLPMGAPRALSFDDATAHVEAEIPEEAFRDESTRAVRLDEYEELKTGAVRSPATEAIEVTEAATETTRVAKPGELPLEELKREMEAKAAEADAQLRATTRMPVPSPPDEEASEAGAPSAHEGPVAFDPDADEMMNTVRRLPNARDLGISRDPETGEFVREGAPGDAEAPIPSPAEGPAARLGTGGSSKRPTMPPLARAPLPHAEAGSPPRAPGAQPPPSRPSKTPPPHELEADPFSTVPPALKPLPSADALHARGEDGVSLPAEGLDPDGGFASEHAELSWSGVRVFGRDPAPFSPGLADLAKDVWGGEEASGDALEPERLAEAESLVARGQLSEALRLYQDLATASPSDETLWSRVSEIARLLQEQREGS